MQQMERLECKKDHEMKKIYGEKSFLMIGLIINVLFIDSCQSEG
jgi:hypothetical protein